MQQFPYKPVIINGVTEPLFEWPLYLAGAHLVAERFLAPQPTCLCYDSFLPWGLNLVGSCRDPEISSDFSEINNFPPYIHGQYHPIGTSNNHANVLFHALFQAIFENILRGKAEL